LVPQQRKRDPEAICNIRGVWHSTGVDANNYSPGTVGIEIKQGLAYSSKQIGALPERLHTHVERVGVPLLHLYPAVVLRDYEEARYVEEIPDRWNIVCI
jgi:hypothetical protein